MNLNLTLLGQAISFAIFVIFCMKYVWPPITSAMRERQDKIAKGLADAEQSEQRREEAEQEIAALLQDAKNQAAEIISQAQKRSNEIVEEAKDAARTESDRIKATAQAEIDQEVVRAKEELRKQVGAIALSGAEKILGSEVSSDAHGRILDDLVAQI
ncbi:F0F1 ATP synthase subunit B [Granulosicoccaceae sp. 1_MG-2023]|nr:F0F1 ATP synthase subunit B [Granulosicoccaceae sp. 1_MG-2023]